jgi:competence protein ComEC
MTVGKLNGKIINYTNILLVILLGFLILNPLVVLYDIGFHLSFLSIVALVYITPIFNQYFKSNNQYIKNILVVFNASSAVTILLIPYLVYIFKEFNVMSLIFNIFLIPFSGLLLGMVFLVVLIGML